MPGVVMDNVSIGEAKQGPGVHGPGNGVLASVEGSNAPEGLQNGSAHVNGAGREPDGYGNAALDGTVSAITKEPPELPHITMGFFPFTTLVNRSVQQCWIELSELVTELAEIQVPQQDQSNALNAKSSGNQSSENVHKKLRLLNFAHSKRAEFIKLLVLSQWSRSAADVSKLIDLQGFIRTRHQAYMGALQSVGDMKRDLVRAQVANPDLKTALEVLSHGKVVAMPDLGYKPPKPLTAKSTLRKLQKINRIISVRLSLHDSIPRAFNTYRVHDGRVTFTVPAEFELDLSVGEENKSSQFYFVDIRFLFYPSSPIPKGRIFNELDLKINDTLRESGLTGCFDLLHGLVLTNKINILHKQAVELARGLWSDVLRVEFLHRTLVVQYWATKPGIKSWLEIGMKSGRRGGSNTCTPGVPYLDLRWMRDGREVDKEEVKFDTENLSMECILRSVIALHISHILASSYTQINESQLFSTGSLSLRAQLSGTEPGDCHVDVQLTSSRHLRVSIEPMSGTYILASTPSILDRPENERPSDKSAVDEIVSRVSRIRCIAAIEEVESNVKLLGFETVNPRGLRLDVRRILPPNVLRFSFFSHRLWKHDVVIAATSSMDSDNWWVVQLRPTPSAQSRPGFDVGNNTSILRSAQSISQSFLISQQQSYTAFADLEHCLSGMLAVHANARYLAELQSIHFYPHLQKLQIGPSLQVPDIFIRYQPSTLPPAFRLAFPARLKRKSYIKDTVRLAFHGIDPRKKVAIIVGYGKLLVSPKTLGTLISKWDRSLVFQQKGNGFAIRLPAPAGQSVILDLIQSLQRLECVLAIVESLQRRKMSPQSLSLSRVAFAYSPEHNLSASIDISNSNSSAEIEPADVASKADRLFHLHLGINFDHPNPHRRIKESLTSILNNPFTDAGLGFVIEMLPLTLPLLRSLDRITSNPSHKEALRIQVTTRSARTFQIHYPTQRYRFQLQACQHLSRMAWTLKDVSGLQDRSRQDQLVSNLRNSLYNAKGDGWRGLGNGVVAEVDKVGNLILELHKCFTSITDDAGMYVSEDKEADKQASTAGQAGSGDKPSGPNPITGPTAGNIQQPGPATSKNPDIIMID